MDKLEYIVESIVFLSGEPISKLDICEKLNIDKKELKKVVELLKQKYSGDSGVILLEFGEKLQFSTNKEYADAVSTVLNPIKEKALSKAAMETLSIIAYKQPVTRLDIEDIRGVGSDYTLNLLLENNLIEIVGRKEALGKPLLFGTTDEFLRRFELNSLEDLPNYEKLLERLDTIKEKRNDDRLFNFENLPDVDKKEKSIETENKEKLSKESYKKDSFEDELLDDDDDDDFI